MTVNECTEYVLSHLETHYTENNGAYKAGRFITPSGSVNHSVGCAQPNVDVFVKSMNKDGAGWGVNAILGDFHKGEGRIVQTLPLNARPWGCGKGSRGSWNNSRVQWEVCEPAGHTYAGGTMIGYNVQKNQQYFDRMWKMLVCWNVYICKMYGFGVDAIADHAESHKAGYGSNHADMGQWLPKHGKSMDALRQEVAAILASEDSSPAKGTEIMGKSKATVDQMVAYLKYVAPGVVESVKDLPQIYLGEGAIEGVRGDIAFAQSCLETGNFGFAGSAVTLDQNNFCGMGVTSNGMKGNSFPSPVIGIRAQIQHLKAYAADSELVSDCVDPRFKYVSRGSAPYVEWLGQNENPNGKGWATGAGYGAKILSILEKILAIGVDTPKEDDDMAAQRYNAISELPEYAKKTLIKMIDKGFIGGTGTGKKDDNGRPADLNLSMDMIRIFVTNDRAGLYDE